VDPMESLGSSDSSFPDFDIPNEKVAIEKLDKTPINYNTEYKRNSISR